MVRKIFSVLNREIVSVHGIAYLLGFFALLAQILALLRDRLLASTFGASTTLDVYYAAFRIPDLIFVTVASLVSISILVPIFTKKKEEGKDWRELVDSIFTVFSLIIILVAVIAFFLIPFITPKLFPGIVGENANTLILMSRILLLSPIFLGLSNFFASIVQIHNRFFLYALSPILYNLGIIAGIYFLYPAMGLYGLAIGVCIGALLHCLIQLPFLIKEGKFPRLRPKINLGEVGKIVVMSIPRTITLSAGSISIFFLLSLASVLGAGAISIFNFSFNLQTGPLSIIGVSYASAVFPLLSRLFAEGQREAFLERMVSVTKHIFFWSLPACALFIVLRAQIVRVVLGAGQFSWTDTRLTAATLAIFTLSMIPQSLILLFVRAFYSEGKTWKPLIINIFSMFVTVLFAYFFLFAYQTYPIFLYFIQNILRIEDVAGSAVVMLALAYSLGITVNTILHWIAFEKEFPTYTRSVLKNIFQSFASSVIIGLVAYKMLDVFDKIFDINTFMGIFFQGLCAGIIGIMGGIFILKILKSRELDEVWATFHRKIWKIDKKEVVVEKLVDTQNP